MTDNAVCRSCGAAIEWVQTSRNKRMPLDVEPATCPACAGVGCRKCEGGGTIRMPHFATCPQASKWRRRPR